MPNVLMPIDRQHATSSGGANTMHFQTTYWASATVTTEILPKEAVVEEPFFGYEAYADEDWDGLGARSITADVLIAARKLSSRLPAQFSAPHIAPGADGSIGFEWHFASGWVRKVFIDILPDLSVRAYRSDRNGQNKTYHVASVGQAEGLFSSLFPSLLWG